MKIAVLGSGLMGSAAAKYLAERKEVKWVQLVDKDRVRLRKTAKWVRNNKLMLRQLDVADRNALAESLKGYDSALIALPHSLALTADQATSDAGVSAADLSFEDEQMKMHTQCKKAGITLIPGCGVAPGLAQILAGEAARQLDSVDEIHIYVGGIPQTPKPPLNYRVVFSLESVLGMYADRTVRIVQDGKIKITRALTEVEPISFPRPFEDMEAFLTDGLASLIYTMRGRVKVMDEKTVRYRGHAQQIRTLIETGLLSNELVEFRSLKIRPREFLSAVLGPKIMLGKERDVTLLRVVVKGKKNESERRYTYEMVDHYDEREHVTSMARTTAYTGAIAAMMLANNTITQKGIAPPETTFVGRNYRILMDQLAQKDMKVSTAVTTRTLLD